MSVADIAKEIAIRIKLFHIIRPIYQRHLRRLIPTSTMKEDKHFFDSHKAEIRKVMNGLNDELSIRTYSAVIEYRSTGKVLLDQIKKPISDQYFSPEIIQIKRNEVYVDCGAFTGDTAESFVRHGEGYSEIHAFEASKDNFKKLAECSKTYHDFYTYQAAVWNENTTVSFQNNDVPTHGKVKMHSSAQDEQMRAVKLDDILVNRNVSFIKMDIEGAEARGLEGCKRILERNRPILAICIYHSAEDMVRIPLCLQNSLIDYHFYVRHYTSYTNETVFYAIPIERSKY